MPSGRPAALALILIVALGSIPAVHASAGSPESAAARNEEAVSATVRALEEAAGAPLQVSRSPVNGLVTFLSVPPGHAVPAGGADDLAPARALAFLETHGRAFGLAGAGAVRVMSLKGDELGLQHVRFRQLHRGVPVTAGELLVHVSSKGVVAVNGETLDGLEGISVEPGLTAEKASERVHDFLARRRDIPTATLSEPRLEVFNRGLLEGRRQPTRLAWFIEATGPGLRRYVWVDAERGGILLDFSQLAHALNRQIYNANGGNLLPGTLMRTEGGPPTGNPDADAAYDHAGDTYNYYLTYHGRDSYNGAGAPLVSTVNFCTPPGACPYANAFWTGPPLSQMVYGSGFSRADDVVAHELTHAVTESEVNLFYYMQSGALNESYSDIFGETVDLLNGRGDDSPGVRWKMGEEVPVFGAARDMMDPTFFGDPGKMSDSQFVCLDPGNDAGGVHSNSGVPNHAYALMVDGGTYNGFTVAGIGLVKAGRIQYRALTTYLVSGSDFLDNYNLLRQSCTDYIGIAGITAADCTEMGKALDAVQMANTWPCPAASQVPNLCPAGQLVNTLFLDTLETVPPPNWSTQTLTGTNKWFQGSFFATTGVYHFWGKNDDLVNDSTVLKNTPIALPAGAHLQFNHSYGFENNPLAGQFYDGGIVEYSTNGSTWVDAGPLISAGATYGGILSSCCGNPLSGRSAFVRESWGYTASQLDLSSLAGSNVQIRFRIGTDGSFGDYGWFVDDVRFYTCFTPPPPTLSIGDATVAEGNSGTTNASFPVTLSRAVLTPVTVDFQTANGSAAAGSDYVANAGTVTFAAGTTVQAIPVTVNGDTTNEVSENFFVNLGNPSGATIADGSAEGTITDDELAKFYPLTPCRAADTRNATGPSGAPPLGGNQVRLFPAGGLCGVPLDAKAVAINVTVVGSTHLGNLRLFAANAPVPLASTINIPTVRARANSAVVPLGTQGKIAVQCDMPSSSGLVHFIFDVYGYFK